VRELIMREATVAIRLVQMLLLMSDVVGIQPQLEVLKL